MLAPRPNQVALIGTLDIFFLRGAQVELCDPNSSLRSFYSDVEPTLWAHPDFHLQVQVHAFQAWIQAVASSRKTSCLPLNWSKSPSVENPINVCSNFEQKVGFPGRTEKKPTATAWTRAWKSWTYEVWMSSVSALPSSTLQKPGKEKGMLRTE